MTIHLVKKTSRLTAFCALFIGTSLSYAQQQNTVWKTSGNTYENNMFLGTVNERPLIFKTNGLQRFHITGSGRIGIGTDAPQDFLMLVEVLFSEDL